MKLVTAKIVADIQALQHALYQMHTRLDETVSDLDERYSDNLKDKWQGATTAELNMQREVCTELECIGHSLQTLQGMASHAADDAWHLNHSESSSFEHRILNRSAK